MYVSKTTASWRKPTNQRAIRNNVAALTKESMYELTCFLIDNSFIKVAKHVFRQNRGIPMGTACSPYLANLYLYALEHAFMDKLTKKDINEARKFKDSFRYIDDLIAFNVSGKFSEHREEIYPETLAWSRTNEESDQGCTFLDIKMDIDAKLRVIKTTLYDKRDDFKFNIVGFPHLSANIHFRRSHGVFTSQLIRYCRVMNLEDFSKKTSQLVKKLINQGFSKDILCKKFSSFHDGHYHLVQKYDATMKSMIERCFM
jgi:hypothetical protein